MLVNDVFSSTGFLCDEEEENKRQLWLKKVGMDPHIIAFGQ